MTPIDSIINSIKEQILHHLIEVAQSLIVGTNNKLEDKITEEITRVETQGGKMFGIFDLIEHDSNTFTIQLRDKATSKKLRGTYFYRARAKIDKRPITATLEFNIEVLSLMADIKWNTKTYQAAIGIGYEKGPPFTVVGRGLADITSLGVCFDIFLGGFSDDGMAVTIGMGGSKICLVPIGATGLALRGFGGTLAANFEPRLRVDGPNPAKPTAADYVAWAGRAAERELDSWQPVSSSAPPVVGGFGITADIITLADSGFIMALHDAGFAVLIPGPVILFGATGILMNSPNATIRADAAINVPDMSVAVGGKADIEFGVAGEPYKIIDVAGKANLFFSCTDPGAFYVNLGTRSNPLTATLIHSKFAKGKGFVQINTKRVTTGLGIVWGMKAEIKGVGLKASTEFVGWGLIGWNPRQVLLGVDFDCGLSLKVWKVKLSFAITGHISAKLAQPVHLVIEAGIEINLAFPLRDIGFDLKLIKYERDIPVAVNVPMLCATDGTEIIEERGCLIGIHGPSGRQWELKSTSTQSIWPDAEIAIPFGRRVQDKTGQAIVMGAPVGTIKEGAYTIDHRIVELKIYQINRAPDDSMIQTELPSLKALWSAGPNGTNSRLHVNANDPFAWLTPYRYTEPASRVSQIDLKQQSFLKGKSEALPSGKEKRFGLISITPTDKILPAKVFAAPHDKLPFRTLAATTFTITFFENEYTTEPIRVDALILIVVGRQDGTVSYNGKNVTRTRQWTVATGVNVSRVVIPLTSSVSSVSITTTNLLIYYVLFRPYDPKLKWRDRTIFQPGEYQIEIKGESKALGVEGSTITWRRKQSFSVQRPEMARPYIHSSTIGDSRIFDAVSSGWNPTPHGMGFPVYTSFYGVIRFKVSYVEKVFGNVWQATVSNAGASPVQYRNMPGFPQLKIQTNPLGEQSIISSSIAWTTAAGGNAPPADQELIIPAPCQTGLGTIELLTVEGSVKKKIDEWSFIGSRYQKFADHLQWTGSLPNGKYTSSGYQSVDDAPTPTHAFNLTNATRSAWALPDDLKINVNPLSETSSLDFLRFLNATGVLVNGSLTGILQKTDTTKLDVLTNTGGKPVAFWLTTPEPVDWRRVKCVFNVSRMTTGITFPAKILPGPDGTSAILVAESEGIPVRLPAGMYTISFTYEMRVNGLPSLRPSGSETSSPVNETTGLQFKLPFE